MKKTMLAAALLCGAVPAFAQQPDGLILPKGFHAQVVADNLGPIRHMALRAGTKAPPEVRAVLADEDSAA